MKLAIISDCTHYQTPDGKIGTENHILLRQLQALCAYFSETLICCPFAEYNTSKVLSVYASANINFYQLPLVGGNTMRAKLKLAAAFPKWLKAYKKAQRFGDVVYMRFPNNLSIPAFFYFLLRRKKVFATFTGTWKKHHGEPATYRFQRWLLSRFFAGPVWVYSDKKLSSNKIFQGFSPSYSCIEWEEETAQVQQRSERIKAEGISFFRLITVGTLAPHKNQSAIIKACVLLRQRNIPFQLTIVGDGVLRPELEQMIERYGLQHDINLAGKKNHEQLRALYRQHDFVVQAPFHEGFGKVPIEGFFHGLIPIINSISMALFITGNGERGFVFDAAKPQSLANAIESISAKAELLPQMIESGRAFAKTQTLEAWAKEYYQTVSRYYNESKPAVEA